MSTPTDVALQSSVGGAAFWWTRPQGIRPVSAAVVTAAGLTFLVSTVAWAIPMHDELDRIGQEAATIDRLLQANLLHTCALTLGTLALGRCLARWATWHQPSE